MSIVGKLKTLWSSKGGSVKKSSYDEFYRQGDYQVFVPEDHSYPATEGKVYKNDEFLQTIHIDLKRGFKDVIEKINQLDEELSWCEEEETEGCKMKLKKKVYEWTKYRLELIPKYFEKPVDAEGYILKLYKNNEIDYSGSMPVDEKCVKYYISGRIGLSVDNWKLVNKVYKYKGYEIIYDNDKAGWFIYKDGKLLSGRRIDNEEMKFKFSDYAKEYIDDLTEEPELVEETKASLYKYRGYRIWISPILIPEYTQVPTNQHKYESFITLLNIEWMCIIFGNKDVEYTEVYQDRGLDILGKAKDKVDELKD